MATVQRSNSGKNKKSKKNSGMSKKVMYAIYGIMGVVLLASVILIIANLPSDTDNTDVDTLPDITDDVVKQDTFKISDDTVLSNELYKNAADFGEDGDLAIKQAVALYKDASAESIPVIISENVDGKLPNADLRPRIASAKILNDETVGWLRIEGTNMNFAVVQSLLNNGYYTSKGYDKNYSYYGVIWAAFNNLFGSRDELSKNTVLFGHNWKNIYASPRVGSESDIMLEQLAAYCYTDYATEHPIINFSIQSEELNWVVVSAFYTEDYWADANSHLDFDYVDPDLTNEQTQLFIDEITKRSEYTSDIELSVEDKFLTISTCTRAKGNTDRQRFVVVAKLLGADEELPVPNYVDNPSPKAPVL